jgi:hypothetical protein
MSPARRDRSRIAPAAVLWNVLIPVVGLALILGAPVIAVGAVAAAAAVAVTAVLAPGTQRRWVAAHLAPHRGG